jgi:hypothetical protein
MFASGELTGFMGSAGLRNVFAPVLYTGNGGTKAVTGTLFQPDLTWIKSRSAIVGHFLFDSTRGVTNSISTNTTAAQLTTATSLTAFDSNGFTLGADTGVNDNAATYASWSWRKSRGYFDIVSYTGNATNRTISHNLAQAPDFIIIKNLTTGATSWIIYNSQIASPAGKYLTFTDSIPASSATVWNNTAPTASVFSLGTSTLTNANTDSFIAYLFCSRIKKAAFGTYTGNGSSSGPTVSTGFAPRLVITKGITGAGTYPWAMNTSSIVTNQLNSGTTDAEGAFATITFGNSGFQVSDTSVNINESGQTYLYMAWR